MLLSVMEVRGGRRPGGPHCIYVLKVEHLLFREYGKFLDNIEIQFQNK
jgi:hypothetical protein